MGWKTVKEHYRIEHLVQITEAGLCIGSAYIHDIIVVGSAGNILKRYERDGWINNDNLSRYQAEIEADPAKFQRLFEAEDTFTASIPVFTYAGGKIIEEACEALGWPNITHAGHCQYENLFSDDKAKIVARAKRNAQAGVEIHTDYIVDLESKIARQRDLLARDAANLAKLEADYPEVASNG